MPTAKRKPKPSATILDHWMLATVPGPGERRLFLALANYHHDRPDGAPTAVTAHPSESPCYATRDHAMRGAAKFPGMPWFAIPRHLAMMECSTILSVLANSGLPGDYMAPGRDSFGRFVAEPAGTPDGAIRVTFSDNRPGSPACSLLHRAMYVLRTLYVARLESDQLPHCSISRAVLVAGILPFVEA